MTKRLPRFAIFLLLSFLAIGLIFSAQANFPPTVFAASNQNQDKQNTDLFDKVWCFVTSCKKEEQKASGQVQNDKKEVITPTPSPRNENKENDSQVLGLSSEDIDKSLSDLDGKVDLLFSYQQQTGNLIKNPSFEANSSGQPTFWSYTNESIEKNTFVNNAKVRAGANALRIEPKDGKTNFGIYQPSISTVFGRPYTLSLYISNQSAGNVTLRIGFWDRAGNKRAGGQEFSVPVNTASSQVSVGKTGFTKYSYTLNPNSGIHIGQDFYPMIEVSNAKSGNVYLDDISLTDNSGLGLFESKTTSTSIGGGSVIIDDNANIYPVTTGTGSLGISDNKFTALYLSKATIDKDGNLSIGGNADVDGTLTVDGNSTLSGTLGVSGATTLSSTLSVSGATTFNSVAYTWPSSQGTSGSVLSNNGSGTLSWGTISASGITADSLDFTEFKDAMTLDATTNIAFAGFNLTTSGSGTMTVGNTGGLVANTFSSSGATITGGTINGTSIGATSTSTGAFTTLTTSGTINSNTFTSTALTFAGAAPAISAATAGTNITLDAGTTGQVNIGGTSSGDINLGGGSSSTGCTVTNSTGTLACSGNITAGSTGNAGYWTRSGTTLTPLTSTDAVTLAGAFTNSVNGALSAPGTSLTGTWIATGGTATTTKPYVLIEPTGTTSTGWSTSGTGLGVNAASGFTGNLLDLQVNSHATYLSKFSVAATGDTSVHIDNGSGGAFSVYTSLQ